MTEERSAALEVDRFLVEYIESVPHLEALLLLWRSRPQRWGTAQLAEALYLQPRQSEAIATDLARAGFFNLTGEGYEYASDSGEKDQLIAAVDATYRRETVRLSTMLHARGSRALRDFAQSFELKRRKES